MASRSACSGRPHSLIRNDDLGIAGVDHEDGEKLGRFGVARVVADLVMIARLLRPALAGFVRMLGLVIHFAADGSFQHARINESRGRVTVRGRSGAGCVVDEHGAQALAGSIWQRLIKNDGYFGSWSNVFLSGDARREQGGRGR